MRAALLVVAALALAACTAVRPDAPPPPQVVHELQTVNKATPQPCVPASEMPVRPKTELPLPTKDREPDTRAFVAGADIDIRKLRAYAGELEALLKGCVKP